MFIRRLLIPLIIVGACAYACLPVPGSNSAETAVRQVLNKQVEAWNKGDLDGFMSAYYKSPNTSYVSGDTEVWGYDALRKRYEDRYGKSRQTMGQLSFSGLRILSLGNSDALAIGHWSLQRKDKPDIGGIYSLVFVRSPGGWKIIHDHTSASPIK